MSEKVLNKFYFYATTLLTYSVVPSTYTINSNPWNNEICKQCFLLFSCMGSCCKRMQQVFNYNDNLPCKPFKYNTKRFLEIYYENNK